MENLWLSVGRPRPAGDPCGLCVSDRYPCCHVTTIVWVDLVTLCLMKEGVPLLFRVDGKAFGIRFQLSLT